MKEEDQIQSAIVGYIEAVAPDCIPFAIPNAARRTKSGRASNAVPGLRNGVWDIAVILPNGITAYIECKRKFGQLSDDQVKFGRQLVDRNVPQQVCRSIEDVRAALSSWGVVTRESCPQRPSAPLRIVL